MKCSRNMAAIVTSALFAVGCGGGQPAPESPDGAAAEEVEAADEEGGMEAAAPKDGIVRDADGDGVPDDTSGGQPTCEGKNETQCKITGGCAWTDEGTCVADKGM